MFEKVQPHLWDISILFLFTMFIDITLQVLANILLWHIVFSLLPLSILLSAFVLLLYKHSSSQSKQYDIREFCVPFIAFLLIFIILTFISSMIYPDCYDSNIYHKMAVGFLKNGWNPLIEDSDSFRTNYFHNDQIYSGSPWIDAYGKATWYFAADVYRITNNIESGKVYHLIGILIVFLLMEFYLSQKCPSKKFYNFLIAALIACNPISVVQSASYYVDGFLGSMLLTLLIGLVVMVNSASMSLEAWCIIYPSMCILGNIKFPGLAYGGIFCIVFFLYSLYRYRTTANYKHTCIIRFFIFAFTAFTTIFITGYTTYIKNYIQHHNPLYPLIGKGSLDIITGNSPAGFENKPELFKLFYSIFGEAQNLLQYQRETPLPKLKIPFTFSLKEIHNSINVDMRISGFGVLFSGLLIISLAILIWHFLCLRNKSYRTNKNEILLILTSTIILLVLLIPNSWWARYVPFMYLLVIFPLIILIYFENVRKRILINILSLLLIANLVPFFGSPVFCAYRSVSIRKELQSLRNSTIDVINDREAPGILFNLQDNDIDFNIIFDDSITPEYATYYNMLYYNKK